jgi:hypothetical protein
MKKEDAAGLKAVDVPKTKFHRQRRHETCPRNFPGIRELAMVIALGAIRQRQNHKFADARFAQRKRIWAKEPHQKHNALVRRAAGIGHFPSDDSD